jgi:phage protein D/phage baseplate assembly protein gpV
VTSVATLPAIEVVVGGDALAAPALVALAHVRVHQRLAVPTLCELTFHPRGELDLATLPPLGAGMRVALAEGPELFDGDVTAIEHVHAPDGEHAVLVRGYDPLHRLRRTQHVRAQPDARLAEVADELAAELGLAAEPPDSDVAWQRLLQLGETDMELLTTLAERTGVFATVSDGTLRFVTLEGEGEPVTLTLGEELLEARVELNAGRASSAVTAVGWSPIDAEPHTSTASSPRLGREVAGEPVAGLFEQPGEAAVLDEVILAGDHAAALAQAELDVRAARALTLWGVADGDARLRPGARIETRGLGESGDGAHVLTRVHHTIDERRGFVSEVSTAPPEPHPRPRASVATLGEVTSVGDPEDRGRVQVRLTSYGDVESDWLGVVVPGAGPDKGLIALPDVGDTVLVVLPRGGGEGVVVGGLYGRGRPPDAGVEGGATRRYTLRTPGGQIVTLDDARTAVRVEDATGSHLELSPDRVALHAAVDLEIDAPGRSVSITGKTIDFRQA